MSKRALLGLIGLALAMMALAFYQGGLPLLSKGMAAGGKNFIKLIPMVMLAFIVAGLTTVLASAISIKKWLGEESGWKGLLLGGLGGAIIPGGPYVFYPLAMSLRESGASLGTLVSFIGGKNLWSLGRIPLELALLGTKLTLVRWAVTLFFPPVMGFIAQSIFSRTRLNVTRKDRPV